MTIPKAAIATIIIALAITDIVGALGTLVANHTISNSGSITVVGVNVYSNSACTTTLSTINWGTVNAGSASTYTIYVKNTGNLEETLSMTTSGWSPSTASSYITLTWNATGAVVSAGGDVAALLTLTVSSSITGVTSFSFNMTITGTQ
jgi:hypothetical protein